MKLSDIEYGNQLLKLGFVPTTERGPFPPEVSNGIMKLDLPDGTVWAREMHHWVNLAISFGNIAPDAEHITTLASANLVETVEYIKDTLPVVRKMHDYMAAHPELQNIEYGITAYNHPSIRVAYRFSFLIKKSEYDNPLDDYKDAFGDDRFEIVVDHRALKEPGRVFNEIDYIVKHRK